MPRPSSPVHAKASTNCPYLTLESPHHQRQRWDDPKANQNSAEQRCRSILVWMIIISARLSGAVTQPKPRSAPLVIEPAASFPPAEASDPLKADTFTASILRTHSQCQRGPHSRPVSPRRSGELVSSSLGYASKRVAAKPRRQPWPCQAGRSRCARIGGAYRDRTDDLKLAKLALSQLS